MNYFEDFLRLLTLTLHHGKHYQTLLEHVIKAVLQGEMFQTRSDQCLPNIIQSSHYVGSDRDNFYSKDGKHCFSANIVRNFCRDVIRQV
jgi:superoxide dismutase